MLLLAHKFLVFLEILFMVLFHKIVTLICTHEIFSYVLEKEEK